jgi:hypothetical protein
LALLLLERTNPFRAELSVPVFIKELVEIGGMFRLVARTFAGFAGGAYLNYKFGWQTFVEDLRTLNSITKALESRVKEINSLKKHGGLRRSVFLDARSGNYQDLNRAINSTWGWICKADVSGSAHVKVHGTIRWVPTRDFSKDLEKLNVVNLAFRKLFDLEKIDAQTVWEMIPFSWLADYFIDIGGYLAANNGGAVIAPYDICIVRIYESITTGTAVNPVDNGVYNSGTTKGTYRIYKRDVIGSPPSFPTIRRGLLSWSQWKIVLALFAKFRG